VPQDYPTVQAAVNAALDYDTILVSPGSYAEDVVIQEKFVFLHAPAGPDSTSLLGLDWQAYDGQSIPMDLVGWHFLGPVRIVVELDANLTLRECVFEDSLRCWPVQSVVLRVIDCDFRGYTNLSNFADFSVLSITGSSFQGATVEALSNEDLFLSNSHATGSRLYIDGENTLTITDCTFTEGSHLLAVATDLAGTISRCFFADADTALHVGGPGMLNHHLQLEGNTFRSSRIGVLTSWYVYAENNLFVRCDTAIVLREECYAVGNVVDSCGVGIVVKDGRAVFTDQVARNTIVNGSGYAITYELEYPASVGNLSNNLVVGNELGIRVPDWMDPAQIACNNVWNNAGGNWFGIPNPTGSNGNISLDPLFCDFENGNYHLQEGSPCAPFSDPNPECDLIGALGVQCPPAETPGPALGERRRWKLVASPNPFTRRTLLRLDVLPVPPDTPCRLDIYSVTGRRIASREGNVGDLAATGVRWDGRDARGLPTPSGIYFIRLTMGTEHGAVSVHKIR
jgi:hypothetical protein